MRINNIISLIGISLLGTATLFGSRPNIVFILADDMGYGDIGAYNPNSRIPTPNLDRLANEGIHFTDAHSGGSLCHPSRYTLMTGQYSFRVDTSPWRTQPIIAEGRVTLPSLLRSTGYHTAMVGKWHLGFKEEGYDKPFHGGPYDRGFDSYFGIRASTDIPPYFYIRNRDADEPSNWIEKNGPGEGEFWTPIQGEFWREGGIAPGLKLIDVLPRFTDEAVKVIDTHADKDGDQPLFLYLAYPAPHTPWLPTEEYLGTSKAGMYGDFTVMVDAMVGKVLQALEDNGMKDNTLVLFSSDNGPVWYDKDVEHFGHDSAGNFRGMKGDVWEAGHRVPFIARWPGKIKPARKSDDLISFADVIATAADITGANLPADGAEDSFSFLPVLEGTGSAGRESLITHSGNGYKAIHKDGWKLINGPYSGGFSESLIKNKRSVPKVNGEFVEGQLYNMREDPYEQNNLWHQYPEKVQQLQSELRQAVDAGYTAGHVTRVGSASDGRKAIPVILDTDIGTDIDDTWALAYLLRCPELDLKMVLCGISDTEYRGRIAAKFLEVAGRTDIPVGIGPSGDPYGLFQLPWIEDYQLSDYPGIVYEDGVDALIRMVHSSIEPITLIAVGPVPNIREALRRDPSISRKINFVGMHGSIDIGYGGGEPVAEANVRSAVEAFKKTLAADWLSFQITPLDTCGFVAIDGRNYQQLKSSNDPVLRALFENYKIWSGLVTWMEVDFFDERSSTLFDTVAVYMAFTDKLLEYETIPISVNKDGFTLRDPEGKPTKTAIRWKDLDQFHDHLTRRLLTTHN